MWGRENSKNDREKNSMVTSKTPLSVYKRLSCGINMLCCLFRKYSLILLVSATIMIQQSTGSVNILDWSTILTQWKMWMVPPEISAKCARPDIHLFWAGCRLFILHCLLSWGWTHGNSPRIDQTFPTATLKLYLEGSDLWFRAEIVGYW